MVGLSVTRGRLPAARVLGCPGTVSSVCNLVPNGMPVSPAMTDGSHAPLGVAEKTSPRLSTTLTQVVSLLPLVVVDAGIVTGGARMPGRDSIEAFAGSMSLRRSAAYSFDNSISSGILEN